MRIVTVNEYRVEVTLTEEELRDFDMTYDRLDYANADTRRVMWTLLAEIRRMNGVDLDLSGRLLIEVRREADGCCRVCFTALPPRNGQAGSVKQLVKSDAEPVILESPDLDSVIRAAAVCPPDRDSALYYQGGRYRLILRVPSDERRSVILRLCEFGELPGRTALLAAQCDEHWKRLAEGDAVPVLRRLAR